MKKRNLSVDYMRMIAAILVVSIHTPHLTGINPLLTYSIVDVLPRIAVPFFFAISGFYFINASTQKQLKQISNIVKEYIIVTVAYLVFSILFSVITHSELAFSFFGFVFSFFTSGVEGHLWFFSTLIYSMLFIYFWNVVFKKEKLKFVCAVAIILYLIGLLGCSYYEIGIKLPGASLLFDNPYFVIIRRMILMGFPFFVSGHLVRVINERFSPKVALKSLIIFSALFLIEIYVLYCLKIYDTIVINLFLYPLTISLIWYLVSKPRGKNDWLAKYCKDTSMTMYYYHLMLLSVLLMFNDNDTYNFLIVITVFAVIGLIKSIIKKDKSMKEKVKKANV